MIKCVNCGNEIEDDSDFCYFCGFSPNEKLSQEEAKEAEEIAREAKQLQREIADAKKAYFDYEIHGKPLWEIQGNRGRRLYVYEHKCVIKVDITIGSVITSNATDGEKTIYYKDIISRLDEIKR